MFCQQDPERYTDTSWQIHRTWGRNGHTLPITPPSRSPTNSAANTPIVTAPLRSEQNGIYDTITVSTYLFIFPTLVALKPFIAVKQSYKRSLDLKMSTINDAQIAIRIVMILKRTHQVYFIIQYRKLRLLGHPFGYDFFLKILHNSIVCHYFFLNSESITKLAQIIY